MDYRILIVDDIFINRMLLKEVIKNFSKFCFEAQNGKEAIEILQREELDVILMDIEMPVMNGVETTKYIREKFNYPKKNIPIIALTAYNPDIFFNDYSTIGFNQLITKPYSIDGLKKTIEDICSNARH